MPEIQLRHIIHLWVYNNIKRPYYNLTAWIRWKFANDYLLVRHVRADGSKRIMKIKKPKYFPWNAKLTINDVKRSWEVAEKLVSMGVLPPNDKLDQ